MGYPFSCRAYFIALTIRSTHGAVRSPPFPTEGFLMFIFPEENPVPLTSSLQSFGFLLTVGIIAFVVVGAFSLVFGPLGGVP